MNNKEGLLAQDPNNEKGYFEQELWQKKTHFLDVVRKSLEANTDDSLEEKENHLEKIGEALALSLEIHKDQAPREDGPYVFHVLRVATRLVEEFGITNQENIIAALLHDSIEDQSEALAKLSQGDGSVKNKALSYLEHTFGKRVRDIVLKLCNPDIDKSQPKQVYLDDYAQHIREATEDLAVLSIKLSDFMDNGLNLDSIKDNSKRLWYSQKYLPVMEIFTERLNEHPSVFSLEKTNEIKAILVAEADKTKDFIASFLD
ncbi:MAG: HD domain-containing protein [Candidatus Falkowbacteria bacterium]|nr:HD domain-containing protein [Candidatus Falkowbacteria bacterium]